MEFEEGTQGVTNSVLNQYIVMETHSYSATIILRSNDDSR